MITRVKILGYKSFRDAEIRLKPPTVIIGPNGAGKSNLFDALGLLSRMVTRSSLQEAFEGHRGIPLEAFHWGDGGMRTLLSRPTAEFTIEVDVQLSPSVVETVEHRIQEMRGDLSGEKAKPRKRWVTESYLRYTLTVQIHTDSGSLGVMQERLVALNQDGSEKESRKPFVWSEGERLRMRLEGQPLYTDYEIGLHHTLVSMPLYPPYHPHVTAFREELARWQFYYFNPEVMRATAPVKEVRSIGDFGADMVAFYNTLKHHAPRQFEAFSDALRSLLPQADWLEITRTPEGGLHLGIGENGTVFPARVISEGTIRVLGLMAAVHPFAPTTVVGCEEPENGIHPQRLPALAEFLLGAVKGGKQIIVNTHSPALPAYFAPELLVVCRKEEGATLFYPIENRNCSNPHAGG